MMTTEILPIFFELLTQPPYYAAMSIDNWRTLTGCQYPKLNQEFDMPEYGKRLRVIGGELDNGIVYVEDVE